MTKYLILLFLFINISCNQNTEEIEKESKKELEEVQAKEFVKTVKTLEKINDSLNVTNTIDTVNLKKDKTQDKVDVITNTCSISGKVKFTHDLLGAPYVEGGNNGPSFPELVKKATSENYSYKIEFYLKGKLKHEIITNYKNHFHYKFKANKNTLYKVKFYFKNSNQSEFKEITSANFHSSYLKIKNESKKKWDIYRVFYTV